MTRNELIDAIEQLYGLDDDFVEAVINKLGYRAFSIDALRLLYRLQEEYEHARIDYLNRTESWFEKR